MAPPSFEPQLERLTGRKRLPPSEELAPLVPDVPEVLVRDDAGTRQAMVRVVGCGGGIQLRRRPLLPGGPLPIEEADDQLGFECPGRQRASWPRMAEVRQVPRLGDEPVEAPEVAEHRLDGIVGQVVEREEAALLPFLTLPGDRAVGPPAAEGGGAVGFLLDADHELVINRLHT